MRLSDKCWVLSRSYGIKETTVNECTRGDYTTEEFYVTERDAWLAEAVRCKEEAERKESEASAWRDRQSEAVGKARALEQNS